MKNKKWIRPLLILMVIFIVGTGIMSFLSLCELNSPNPFRAAYGAAKILWTDTPYVQIRTDPCVVISKPENAQERMVAYVESQGYTHLPEKRLGAVFVFTKDGKQQYVSFGVNGYYSLWTFEKP